MSATDPLYACESADSSTFSNNNDLRAACSFTYHLTATNASTFYLCTTPESTPNSTLRTDHLYYDNDCVRFRFRLIHLETLRFESSTHVGTPLKRWNRLET